MDTVQVKMPDWLARGYTLLYIVLPWSIEVQSDYWGMVLPTEPLLAILSIGLLVVFWRIPAARTAWYQAGTSMQRWLFGLVLAGIGWQILTTFSSAYPLVSWKYSIVMLTHIWVFGMGALLFPAYILRWIQYFGLSFLGVVAVTLFRHGWYFDWHVNQAVLAPMPFFENHTGYAAAIVCVLFAMLIFMNGEKKQIINTLPALFLPVYRLPVRAYYAFIVLLLVGLVASTCRAAWMSLVGAAAMGIFFTLRLRWPIKLVLAGMACIALYGLQPIMEARAKSDVSAAERLNRYSCARRMVADRPWAGWGPGTYQFVYMPYQRPEEMTRISITTPVLKHNLTDMGRGGGAHSEYYRALSESGWPGLVLLLTNVLFVLATAGSLYITVDNRFYRQIIGCLTLSFLAFWIHGLFNNFFHDARFAAWIWLCIVILIKSPLTAFLPGSKT
jgi:putative inorganic carbon (hco3(-)) transporter